MHRKTEQVSFGLDENIVFPRPLPSACFCSLSVSANGFMLCNALVLCTFFGDFSLSSAHGLVEVQLNCGGPVCPLRDTKKSVE